MPKLISGPESVSGGRVAMPGPREPGFDPWCLTDPHSSSGWQHDRAAQRAITFALAAGSRPSADLSIQSEISAPLAAGPSRYATDHAGNPLGNYYCCPCSPIWTTVRATTIAGTRLREGQQFAFDVSAEEMSGGGRSSASCSSADFSPTDQIDYCDE